MSSNRCTSDHQSREAVDLPGPPLGHVAAHTVPRTSCQHPGTPNPAAAHTAAQRVRFRVPDAKTGGWIVPLGPKARADLAGLRHQDDNPWVIIGKLPGSHITDLQKPWRRICAPDWWTCEFKTSTIHLHHRRRSFAPLTSGGASVRTTPSTPARPTVDGLGPFQPVSASG